MIGVGLTVTESETINLNTDTVVKLNTVTAAGTVMTGKGRKPHPRDR